MKQKVINRIKTWKRFYARQAGTLDENASWKDIFLKLNLSYLESIMLGKAAIEQCNPFDMDEMLYLGKLPLYTEIKELISSMPNQSFGDYFRSSMPTGDDIYFVRYPALAEVGPNDNMFNVPIVVATVVYHRPVDFDEDIYVWCGRSCLVDNTSKHLIIRYANEKPKDFHLET